jgi:Tfp pilus assembly protein PilO
MSRKVILIAMVALFGIAAIWYVGLWAPQGASLRKAQASATSAEQKESTLKAQVATLQRQRAGLPALQAQLDQLNQAVPAAVGIDKVIDNVNAVALASGVTLSSLTPPLLAATAAGAASVSSAVSMTVTVAVSGTYFQLVDFINKLNSMPRLAVVDSFSLGTPDKATGKIATSISARVFVAPAPAVAPAKTTTTTTGGTH